MDDQGRKGAFTKEKATIKKIYFHFSWNVSVLEAFFPPKIVGISGLRRSTCI